MDSIKIQSLRILQKTFCTVRNEHIHAIEILLLRLSTIRRDKVCLSTTFAHEMAEAKKDCDECRRWMIIYLAVVTLIKPENRRYLKRYIGKDLRLYDAKLYAKMIKISDIDYNHFKNVVNMK